VGDESERTGRKKSAEKKNFDKSAVGKGGGKGGGDCHKEKKKWWKISGTQPTLMETNTGKGVGNRKNDQFSKVWTEVRMNGGGGGKKKKK